MPTRRSTLIALSALAAAARPSWGADAYPSKPIHYVAPFAPGGATDIVARLVGERLSGKLGQPVLVENRSGAGGLTGTRQVAASPGDGYTVVGVSFNFLIYPVLFKKVGFDMFTDLSPITQVATYPSVLLVPATSKYRSVQDMVNDARKTSERLSFASSGVGTASHIAGELFKRETQLGLVHVPYRGGGPANVDLMAGNVSMHFANVGSSIEFVRGGRLRPLAVATAKRIPSLPEVPTMRELGYKDFLINEFQGILAPGTTPREIVSRLNQDVVAILREPAISAKFEAMGGQIVASTPAEFGSMLQSESAKWCAIAQAAGVVPE